jgi:glycosyltransferase involved in cell wall biosynthesis
MRPVIATASVCVVPLRIGSGTRLKILEAAAMGKAIVSTHLGVEGLKFVNGRELLLADEPQAFAQAVAILLADPDRRQALGQAARRRVEDEYSLPVLQSAVRAVIAASLLKLPAGGGRQQSHCDKRMACP